MINSDASKEVKTETDEAKGNCKSTTTIAVYGDFQHIPQSFQTTIKGKCVDIPVSRVMVGWKCS